MGRRGKGYSTSLLTDVGIRCLGVKRFIKVTNDKVEMKTSFEDRR